MRNMLWSLNAESDVSQRTERIMRCATSKAATRASLWTPIRTSSRRPINRQSSGGYLFGFLAWTVLNAIVIALCAGASVLTIKRIK